MIYLTLFIFGAFFDYLIFLGTKFRSGYFNFSEYQRFQIENLKYTNDKNVRIVSIVSLSIALPLSVYSMERFPNFGQLVLILSISGIIVTNIYLVLIRTK